MCFKALVPLRIAYANLFLYNISLIYNFEIFNAIEIAKLLHEVYEEFYEFSRTLMKHGYFTLDQTSYAHINFFVYQRKRYIHYRLIYYPVIFV